MYVRVATKSERREEENGGCDDKEGNMKGGVGKKRDCSRPSSLFYTSRHFPRHVLVRGILITLHRCKSALHDLPTN
jgi:hypothetical protein